MITHEEFRKAEEIGAISSEFSARVQREIQSLHAVLAKHCVQIADLEVELGLARRDRGALRAHVQEIRSLFAAMVDYAKENDRIGMECEAYARLHKILSATELVNQWPVEG